MVDNDIVRAAWEAGTMVPAFNVPHLPMLEPIVRAVVDQDAFALIETARIEWQRFECYGPAAVQEAFARFGDPDHVRLHLDHVPVVDEDDLAVDYAPIVRRAISLGYDSVMIDGSRLDLEGNIAATREVAEMAHAAGIPCEAELGAILREGARLHSGAGPLPPYEELFASGLGFTDVDEAARFVAETGCDWLSVAVGNVHGAVSKAFRDRKKTQAHLNLDHLARLRRRPACRWSCTAARASCGRTFLRRSREASPRSTWRRRSARPSRKGSARAGWRRARRPSTSAPRG